MLSDHITLKNQYSDAASLQDELTKQDTFRMDL